MIEGDGGTSLFLLACNDISALSKALDVPRCTMLEFAPLAPEEMRLLLSRALARSPFQLDGATLDSIVKTAEGIPRDALKLLLEEGGRSPPLHPRDRLGEPTGRPKPAAPPAVEMGTRVTCRGGPDPGPIVDLR